MMELVTLLLVVALGFLAALGLQWAGRRSSSDYPISEPQKTPFLGGASPRMHAWSRYHVRYYSMALLFIAFEMEMMFMYPWAVVYVEEGIKAMAEMGMFLAILSIGIVYGWREGVFRWQ